MESLTLTAIAILILTKAFEKTGEVLGQKILEQGGKLLALIRSRDPDMAGAIELAQQQSPNVNQVYLVNALEMLVKNDPEIALAVQAIAFEAKKQLSLTSVRQSMLVGIVTQGNLKADYLTQKANGNGLREQDMICDVQTGSIELGSLTQESL